MIDTPPVPAVLSALTAARSAVRDAGVAPVWSLRDHELATAAAQTLALAAQVNGMLSAVLAETDGRDLLVDWGRRRPLPGCETPSGSPRTRPPLGSYIWEVVDPEAADAAEAERLEVAEQRAHEQRRFALTPVGDGMTRITGRLPDLSAALVRTALDRLAAPLPSSVEGPDARRPGERTADALVEMARRSIAGGLLPDDGGEKPRLVVTVPHTAVPPEPRPETRPATTCPAALGDPTAATQPAATGIARLDDLLRLAPSQLAQIACDCESQTLVVDTLRTLPLWMSRRAACARLIRGSLRRALVVRDGGCAFPSCDRPPQWCDAHHIVFWSEGGESSLANSVLVCGFHHRLLHMEQWQVVMAADGHPDFVPPPWIDPRRQARRQRRHQPLRT